MDPLNPYPEEEKKIYLQDYWRSLEPYIQAVQKRRRSLLAFVFLVCALTAVVSLVMTPTYESVATILPRQTGRSNLASLLSGGLGALAGGSLSLPGGVLGSNTPLDIKAFLDSRMITERVIQALHLDQQFPEVVGHDTLLLKIRKMRVIQAPSLKDPLITVTAQASDPVLAAAMANAYIHQLDRFLQEINYSQGRKTRRFIEERLKLAKGKLERAAKAFTTFQKANKTLSLPEEVTVTAKALAELEAQQMAAGVQFREAEAALQASISRVSTLTGTLDAQTLTELMAKRDALHSRRQALEEAHRRYQDQIMVLPEKGIRFADLKREYTVQEALYTLLTQQKELAMITEAQEPDVFNIVDQATVPERPVKPKKRAMVMMAFAASLLLGLIVCWGLENWEEGKQVAHPPQDEGVLEPTG